MVALYYKMNLKQMQMLCKIQEKIIAISFYSTGA